MNQERRKKDRRLSPAIGEYAIQQNVKLRAINAELLAALQLVSWKPIEMAPKDGTTIDLWDSLYNCRVCNARWDFHCRENGELTGSKGWGRDDRDGPFVGKASHWMPLPEPPQ